MNYLDLINRLRLECGVSGSRLTGLTNLSLEAQRLATWTADAWIDIQALRPDWQFMRRSVAFNSLAQKGEYTADDAGIASTFANWKLDSFTASTDGQNFSDEQELPFMAYDDFRRMYRFGPSRTSYMRPSFITVTPDKSLALGPAPDQDYVIDGEYFAKPVALVEAADIPAIDEHYHLMIVYKAMMAYGTFEAASEVYGRGELEFKKLLGDLLIDRLPTIVSGPPLA